MTQQETICEALRPLVARYGAREVRDALVRVSVEAEEEWRRARGTQDGGDVTKADEESYR